ncbi:MAG: choline dehydrogenase [Alphaproteobacteria bacterium]|nr:choline dehydrogenase [Rhodospirillaceae bacterium]MBT7614788.1 choline dehydrogenase [Rhodospirillaceae bacterium]MBT7647552.1 choline dehydrogenase [Rhodospirillaceae bacterium]MDG2480818.1 choline dehydrogenase [Alphaproteobacteria bacterium]
MEQNTVESVDYLIVGAGSSGCVLASRLSEDPDVTVKVLEAGPADRSLYLLRMPAAAWIIINGRKYNWYYHSEPEPYMDGRRIFYPRGKVLGGSSSINGMVYLRGNPLDYDGWATNQLNNWSFAHCLPYFKKMEKTDGGDEGFRGREGPMEITMGGDSSPLYRAYVEAAQQAGYPFTSDVNGFQQEGVFFMERTVLGGVRNSTARAYLHPALSRPNLTSEVNAHTNKVLFEGNKAVGVEYIQNGETKQVRAEREVIISSGVFNSPQILLRSGVGNAEHLKALDIPVVNDLPGVGENLQDHLDWPIQYFCKQPVSHYSSTTMLGQVKTGLQWFLAKKGVGASNLFEAGGYFRSRPGIEFPNIQHHFVAIAMNYDGSMPNKGHGFQAHISQMRPTSRGFVRLRSTDPFDPPVIQFNHLQTENDRLEFREGLKLTREIIAQDALTPYRGRELAPGADVTSDSDMDAFARATGETEHHPACTNKMGYDEMSVVDRDTKVHGVENLRVVDASIMPNVVTANLNATCIMLGEKAADLIAGREPLEPDYIPFYRAENWETAQR